MSKVFAKGEKLLIVTSPYHVRRCIIMGKRELRGNGIDFTVISTPYEEFHEKKWWADQDSARNVILESSKLLFYFLGGDFGRQKAY